jgi:hypothetical protein
MSRHTPGPWTDNDALRVLSPDQNYVADCDASIALPDKERAANARLIAAAPDLLSIAKRWAAIDGGDWHMARYVIERERLLNDTQASIAKAETP